MSCRSSSAVGKASAVQQMQRLFNLYDVQKKERVCIADFDFVHSLAQQLMGGSNCDLTSVMLGPNHGNLSVADGSIRKKASTGKPCLQPGSFSEEFRKATFSNVDLDGDGCISRHDFYSWLTVLMDRMIKCSGQDQRRPEILIKHVTHMIQTDKRFLAYRSLALSAKRAAAEQDDSRQTFVALAAFQEALGSTEGIVKDDVLVEFQRQLEASQVDLKHKLQNALAAAETLQAREGALRELMEAKSLLILEPPELADLRQFKDIVKASHEPFTIHVSTLAGPEAHVKASHEDSVWSLRMKVAAELNQGLHAYQTTLSNMRGKLENDSATLKDCLLCLSTGDELVATYEKADRWVELSHPEFKEFRCKESNEAACLYRAAEEAEKKARCHKSEANIMEARVKKAKAYCHKTWQEATLEDILIETAAMFDGGYPEESEEED